MILVKINRSPRLFLNKIQRVTGNMIHSSDKIVAVCQMTSIEDKLKNFDCCENLIKSAKEQHAIMAFFPEACDYIGENTSDSVKFAETIDGELISKYKNLARQYDIWLSLGGIHEKFTAEKSYNTHLIINNAGDIVGKYRKTHTFDVELTNRAVSESTYIEKGHAILPPVKTPVGNIGLAICYDIRFPEIGIALTEMGADVLTYPSAFMYETGSAHWETLIRCRAIENQCYVIAAAQTGYHNPKRRSWGHAMIVDPYGTICAQCSEGTGIAVTTVRSDLIEKVRSSMPLMFQKRFDLYPKIAGFSEHGNIDKYQFGQVTINAKVVFYKTEYSLAVVNRRCVVPGHVLIIPIRVIKRFSELSSIEIADLFQTVQKVQIVMEKLHHSNSSSIVIQDGPNAGQTIWHVHVHILPRKPGDFPDNDDIYLMLQKHDKDVKQWRDEEEMIGEANYLRKYFS